jgi:outer membrane protein TolC
MRSFTDVFIRHPVLAAVVNLVIVLVGWRALTNLPVQQYPRIESSSVQITTVYTGASAETVRGFLTTPIERVLAAETARIGVAQAELHPRLALSGNLGLAADEVADLFSSGSGVLGIGPALRWNLFDAGRRRRLVVAQETRAEQALVQWERAVLTALEETENAMTAFVREQARRRSLLEAALQARRAVELARTQYGEGLSDFQTVLDSERALTELEDERAPSDAAIATNFIVLYKARGGAWQDGDRAPSVTL